MKEKADLITLLRMQLDVIEHTIDSESEAKEWVSLLNEVSDKIAVMLDHGINVNTHLGVVGLKNEKKV